MSAPTTFGVSTDEDTKARIQAAATKQGLSLSAYVLSWLPEHQPSTNTRRQAALDRERRKVRGVAELSPAR